jgi:EAL domain-containing protein (putative c-di-GMP-specific phosphodiesterase class I)
MLATLHDVVQALNSHSVFPVFQPQVDLRTGRIVGFEVLARWDHPAHGMILPANFISLAEENGLIGQLTQQILTRSFDCCAMFLPPDITIAINVSPIQLHYASLPAQVRFAAEEARFDLRRLTIEVTESALVRNLDLAGRIARNLRDLGCRLALDDFGTGYSSLKHLSALPFTDLKIDRSFVNDMVRARDARKIVSAVVGLGQSLSLTTIAEGVETEEQATLLQRLACEVGQGWLLGRPVPEDGLPELLAAAPWRPANSAAPYQPPASDVHRSQRLAELQALYDDASFALGLLDRNLRFISANQRLADFHNTSPERLIGRTVADALPEVYDAFEPILRKALAGQAISGINVPKPPNLSSIPGQLFAASFRPTFDEDSEVIGVSIAVMPVADPIDSCESSESRELAK